MESLSCWLLSYVWNHLKCGCGTMLGKWIIITVFSWVKGKSLALSLFGALSLSLGNVLTSFVDNTDPVTTRLTRSLSLSVCRCLSFVSHSVCVAEMKLLSLFDLALLSDAADQESENLTKKKKNKRHCLFRHCSVQREWIEEMNQIGPLNDFLLSHHTHFALSNFRTAKLIMDVFFVIDSNTRLSLCCYKFIMDNWCLLLQVR